MNHGRRAQATVEATLLVLLFGLVVVLVAQTAFWLHAWNVAISAAQEAARAAAAQGGDLALGVAVGERLLDAGLGPSGSSIHLTASEDEVSVTVRASGSWPLALGSNPPLGLPVDTEARVLKDTWTP
jgi:TadE-like protein